MTQCRSEVGGLRLEGGSGVGGGEAPEAVCLASQCEDEQVSNPRCSSRVVPVYSAENKAKQSKTGTSVFPNFSFQRKREAAAGLPLIAEAFYLLLNTSGHVARPSQLASPVGAAARPQGCRLGVQGRRGAGEKLPQSWDLSLLPSPHSPQLQLARRGPNSPALFLFPQLSLFDLLLFLSPPPPSGLFK